MRIEKSHRAWRSRNRRHPPAPPAEEIEAGTTARALVPVTPSRDTRPHGGGHAKARASVAFLTQLSLQYAEGAERRRARRDRLAHAVAAYGTAVTRRARTPRSGTRRTLKA